MGLVLNIVVVVVVVVEIALYVPVADQGVVRSNSLK